MGSYGPDVKCPCPACYACDGVGCDKCADGVRCSKRGFSKCGQELIAAGKTWSPGIMITRSGPRTVTCKLDMGNDS